MNVKLRQSKKYWKIQGSELSSQGKYDGELKARS